MAVLVSPSPIWNGQQFFTNNGLPLNGGRIFQYEANSTSIEQTTYSDVNGLIANSNPIILDSSGRIPVEMYLIDGLAYNLVLTLDDETTVLAYVDNVTGVITAADLAGGGNGVWQTVVDAPVFVNTTTFILENTDYTYEFAVGNRVKTVYPTEVLYGTVSAVSYVPGAPNKTQITLVNDTADQNAGMTSVLWSIADVQGPIVDAGAVTYSLPTTYAIPNTVGHKLDELTTSIVNYSTNIVATYTVLPATGGPTYVATADALITSYTTGQIFVIKFTEATSAASTINISGLGAIALKQYDSSGVVTTAIIVAGMVSQIAYNGTDFILLDPLPVAMPTFSGLHGLSLFTSNGTFTVPDGVYSLSVTCVSGGGGAGSSYSTPGEGYTLGGQGGQGAAAYKVLSVTPGTAYSVSVGAGGNGGIGLWGGNGGSTVFGSSLVVATGGIGGAMSPSTSAAGANGADGYPSVADYGWRSPPFYVGPLTKGAGGLPLGGAEIGTGNGGPGTAGICSVEW
jgi:hypothetical protein